MQKDDKHAEAAARGSPAGQRPGPARTSAGQPDEARTPGLLPDVTLPRGGGAIRGIGEKFSTNPATGTGSLSVPIATSPGRAGFELDLELSYDSGAGNGPFGIGWRLSTPSITRSTDRGLPRYLDGDGSDTFVLSGAEDLVPVATPADAGDADHDVQRYRPRVEGLFARIERWTRTSDGDVHWRTITRDNVLNLYGRGPDARLADPRPDRRDRSKHPAVGRDARVFSWLLEETRDDRGNVARYQYKAEDGAGIEPRLSELSRFRVDDSSAVVRDSDGNPIFEATAQRYLERIQYGNRSPVARDEAAPDDPREWLFEVVFDYGEYTSPGASDPHTTRAPRPESLTPGQPLAISGTGAWTVRRDPFSTYRPGFEVRTYRLCRRALMFHRFPAGTHGLDISPCLVRSTDLLHDQGSAVSYLESVTQAGYLWRTSDGVFERATLPSLSLHHARPPAELDQTVRSVDRSSLEGIPSGIDGRFQQWVDLDGEGLPGILSAHQRSWYYKRNQGGGQLAPPRELRSLPSPAELGAGAQLTDLAGDGQLDLVKYSTPLPGYFTRTEDGDWKPFATFPALPNIDWNDPNLRFLDLDGDGNPDLLITETDAFAWYRSRARAGFEPAIFLPRPRDENRGPAVVFADGTETIFLADMSGDGLVDIARIRNHEVCYWPNLGHGHFGRKITFENSPRFDTPDHFDPGRIRFADVDGSGTSDILYLARDGVAIYLNQSGNALSERKLIRSLPPVDSASSLEVVDLLGQGTSCLVWSSPLPAHRSRPLIYVDPLGSMPAGQHKPHVLTAIVNNLGTETRIAYAPSTAFYLEDRRRGRPWLTRLAFPVQVVARTERVDHIHRSRLVTRFAYHHGYFDGHEREFRGFACVEQWDAESFGEQEGNGLFPGFSHDVAPDDEALDLPPVRTVTWFHTGAWLQRERLERELAKEYHDRDPRAPLLPDTVLPGGLSVKEEREAARALRGKILRQEIYAEDDSAQAEHPYSVSAHNYEIRLVAHADGDGHAIFFAHPRETIDLHYERDPTDPRIQHELVLEVDDLGNVTRSAKVAYPRRSPLEPEQGRPWVTITEHRFANRPGEIDWYRVGVPVESTTSEVKGLALPAAGLFTRDDLLSGFSATEVPYESSSAPGLHRRVIERERRVYYPDYDDVSGYRRNQRGPLALGEITSRALLCETFRQAFTPGLVARIYGSRVSDAILRDEAGYTHADDLWWVGSGRVVFDPARFFLPVEARDAFGSWSGIEYDGHALLLTASREPRVDHEAGSGDVEPDDLRFGSVTRVGQDYRVLAPVALTDPSGNRTAVVLDALGMVARTAVLGKEGAGEGDTLADPTTRIEYDLHRWRTRSSPAVATTYVREQHGVATTRWQESHSYSDGSGREIMKKIQAEAGPVPVLGGDGQLARAADGTPLTAQAGARWVGTGRTVLDNKGNAIKKYEPFFSATPEYEDERQLVEWGVTAIYRYDPLGRRVRTDHPDGTISRVVFDAWSQESWDENDCVEGSAWLEARRGLPGDDPERRAADLTRPHAGTPGVAHLDALSRVFLAVSDNGDGQRYRTRIELDVEGNQLGVTDARGNVTVSQTFDMLGRKIHVRTTDAGEARTLVDAGDKTVRAWDARGHRIRRVHDALQRPTQVWVTEGGGGESLVELTVHGEQHPRAAALNLRGQVLQVFDGAGAVSNLRFDFKGNLLASARRLVRDYKATCSWHALAGLGDVHAIDSAASSLLEAERFETTSTYDALNRVVSRVTPDGSETRVEYNESNLVDKVLVRVRGLGAWTPMVQNIDYSARGQRERIEYGNGAATAYTYDPQTFRITRLRTVRAGDGRVLQDLSYTHDPVGNVLEIRDRSDWVEYSSATPVGGDGRYRYDPLYRLIEAEGREHPGQQPAHGDIPRSSLPHRNDVQALRRYVEKYIYDSVGNIREVAHQAGAERWRRRYDHAASDNRLLATSAPGQPEGQPASHAYTYDSSGNMTSMPHLQRMRWDFDDRLVYTDRGGGGEVFFGHDSDGQRVRKVYEHGGLLEERIYIGSYEVFRKRRIGGEALLERQTLHVRDGQRRVALVETRTFDRETPSENGSTRHRYQLSNHLGSVGVELDESGAVISYEEYFPFGGTAFHAAHSSLDGSPRRYRYTGKERDEETGLYYHGARYYAPWLGRWISPDPAGLIDGINVYAYVRNNPLSMSDPTGLWGWREVAVVAAVVVVGTVVTVATAGAAAPLAAAAVASIGLTGTAATVATGVAVGAVAGAVGGAAAGAAGEGTRQAVHGERVNVGRIASAAGEGAIVGAAIGAAVPLVTAAAAGAAGTTAGAATIAAAGRVGQAVARSGVGRAVAAGGRAVASGARAAAQAPGARQVVQGVRSAAQATSRGLQAVERAGNAVGEKLARATFGGGGQAAGAAGAEAAAVEAAAQSSETSAAAQATRTPWSKARTQQLIDQSEGAAGPGSNVGHARAHVPGAGQDARALAQARPNKANTTVYRNERHALQDLRNVLEAHAGDIDNLAPGASLGGTYNTATIRPGFNSQFGGPATDVSFSQVTVRVARLADGRLHLVHFSPKM